MSNSPIALSLRNIRQSFRQGETVIEILRGVDIDIYHGEVTSLQGPSGAGKSTLLHAAGLLEKTTDGRVTMDGQNIEKLSDAAKSALRREKIGFIYQHHFLLPEFSALENVIVPQMLMGVSRAEARTRAFVLLDEVGLSHRLEHRPGQLSGGEQQRVAIARALANKPQIILADEPTGNLDPETGAKVFDLFISLARKEGMAALIVTHNPDLAKRCDKQLKLENGIVVTL